MSVVMAALNQSPPVSNLGACTPLGGSLSRTRRKPIHGGLSAASLLRTLPEENPHGSGRLANAKVGGISQE